MAVQTVFSSNLDSAAPNLSSRFVDATAFYIDAPLINSELEIDVFLQVYFSTGAGERVRNLALGKISEQSILLNVTDTESVVAIPSEFVGTGLEMALLFLASSTTYLEAYAIGKDCTLCGIQQQIESVENKVNSIESVVNDLANNSSAVSDVLDLILNLILTSIGVPANIIPASTIQQQFFGLQ